MLVVSPALLMFILLPAASDTYEQETRQMFVKWKAKYKKVHKYAGEEESRYALFKDARRHVARANAVWETSSGLNGLSDLAISEIFMGYGGGPRWERNRSSLRGGDPPGVRGLEDQVREDLQRCRRGEVPDNLFKANRHVVVEFSAAAAAGETAYGLKQFGDLTNEEVRESCDRRGGRGNVGKAQRQVPSCRRRGHRL
ncbi:unnamed protein product [Urochloa humidicola]